LKYMVGSVSWSAFQYWNTLWDQSAGVQPNIRIDDGIS
jgi:hypothetical protein